MITTNLAVIFASARIDILNGKCLADTEIYKVIIKTNNEAKVYFEDTQK